MAAIGAAGRRRIAALAGGDAAPDAGSLPLLGRGTKMAPGA